MTKFQLSPLLLIAKRFYYLFFALLLLSLFSAQTIYAHEKQDKEIDNISKEIGEINTTTTENTNQIDRNNSFIQENKKDLERNNNKINIIEDTIFSIEKTHKKNINSQEAHTLLLEEIRKKELDLVDRIKKNNNEINFMKSALKEKSILIEKNSIQVYDNLLKTDSNTEALKEKKDNFNNLDSKIKHSFEEIEKKINDINTYIENRPTNAYRFWLITGTLLSLFIVIGFTLLEIGTLTIRTAREIVTRNMLVLSITFMAYAILGFSIMYGNFFSDLSFNPLYITEIKQLLVHHSINKDINVLEFFLQQSFLALTVTLIISTLLSKHIPIYIHLLIAFFMGLLIYPLTGQFIWGGHWISDYQGWLEGKGFQDFAGVTLIHVTASWFALAILWRLDNKLRKQDQDDKPNTSLSSNYFLSIIGILIIWIAWTALYTTNPFIHLNQVALIIYNLALSAMIAALIAYFFNQLHNIQYPLQSVAGGFLSGLIAVTGICEDILPLEALVIGAVSGILYHLSFMLLRRFILQSNTLFNTTSLATAHLSASLWGTLAVALFGGNALFGLPDLEQFFIQFIGLLSTLLFSFTLGFIFWFTLLRFMIKEKD